MRKLLSRIFGRQGRRRHSPAHEYRILLGDGQVMVFKFANDHNAPMPGAGSGLVLIGEPASEDD